LAGLHRDEIRGSAPDRVVSEGGAIGRACDQGLWIRRVTHRLTVCLRCRPSARASPTRMLDETAPQFR
jgi:hypothetical protein